MDPKTTTNTNPLDTQAADIAADLLFLDPRGELWVPLLGTQKLLPAAKVAAIRAGLDSDHYSAGIADAASASPMLRSVIATALTNGSGAVWLEERTVLLHNMRAEQRSAEAPDSRMVGARFKVMRSKDEQHRFAGKIGVCVDFDSEQGTAILRFEDGRHGIYDICDLRFVQ